MMKKVIIGALLLSALLLSACSNKEADNTITEQSEKIESQNKTIESLETKISTLESAATQSSSSNSKTLTDAELEEAIGDKVLIPDPTLKSKEQVETEFKAEGFTPEFVTAFSPSDEYAGFCNRLSEQPGVTYISYEESNEKSGFYAEKGATITVGYFEKSDN
ncbi:MULTISPECIES: hypothetical protein [Enterococcus]|uniref:hypothetical protein n=1 Tax=Enterococcus TaxID=1350 RepID=UPI00115880A1|nr:MULTISPECIES: hypothetical protein [Enterococcus]